MGKTTEKLPLLASFVDLSTQVETVEASRITFTSANTYKHKNAYCFNFFQEFDKDKKSTFRRKVRNQQQQRRKQLQIRNTTS